jgi:hypothetical protein
MKVNFFSLLVLVLVFFAASCEKEDDIIPQDPEVPIVEDGIDTLITSTGLQFVRTPDEHFQNLPDWPYDYQYVEIDGLATSLRRGRSVQWRSGIIAPRPTKLVLPLPENDACAG